MEYLRMFLIMLRRKENGIYKIAFRNQLLIASIIGIISGLILDMILPFNFYTNAVRGVVANITGVSIFSYGYLMVNRLEEKRKFNNRYYNPIRKRFSFNQRMNISIFISTMAILVILFTSKQDLIFTMKSSLAISSVIMSVAFSRRDRNEFIKDVYEIPDHRDVEFTKKRSEKLKERDTKEDESK